MKPENLLTKAGIKRALIDLGYNRFPAPMGAVEAATVASLAEVEFAQYLIWDTDFGGAWNDSAQIEMHTV